MANNMERAFDWGDTIENDSTWVLLPEGTYHYTVTGLERQRHNGSAKLPPCWKAVLTLSITGAEGTTTVNHSLFLHSKCEGLLCSFFTSIGDRQHGQPLKMDWDHVVGKGGLCEIFVDEWVNEKDGNTYQNNKVKRFLEPQTAPAQNAPAQAQFNW